MEGDYLRPLIEIECDDAVRAVRALPEAGLFGRAVHLFVDGEHVIDDVRATLAREGIRVARVTTIEPTLEDAFVALVTEAGGAVDV